MLFPRGTPCGSSEQLGTWCELIAASWVALATLATVPQVADSQLSDSVLYVLHFNSSFMTAASACMPPPPGAATASGPPAATTSLEVALEPVLQLARLLCRAAHFLAQADAASPVAAALLQVKVMPPALCYTFDMALRMLALPGSLR